MGINATVALFKIIKHMRQMDLSLKEKTELEYRDNNSDKLYTAMIYKGEDDLHYVLFTYGKRYGYQNRVEKHFHTGVPYGEALGIYQEMVDKKLKKGYVNKND
jgi:hypothetical protein